MYAWTFAVSRGTTKELAKIYEVVNDHHQQGQIHVDASTLVTEKVCTALHTALKDDVSEIKRDVKTLLVSSRS